MGQFKGSAYVYTVASVHPGSEPLDTSFAPFKMKLQPHALAMNDYFGASVLTPPPSHPPATYTPFPGLA